MHYGEAHLYENGPQAQRADRGYVAGIDSLALSVRLPVVARYVGELMIGIAFMVGVSGLFAVFVGDFGFAERCALMLVLIAALGLYSRRLPAVNELQVNESLLVVALTFILGCASMVWPLMEAGISVSDATFEAVSGLTTTGLSIVSHPGHQSTAFLFARAWMQWCGGLVIVVLALALVVEPGPVARKLYGTEGAEGGMIEGTRLRARRALMIYTLLLVAGFLLLLLLGAGPFDAIVHSLTAISTGGFSTRSNSIAGLPGYPVRAGVTFLSVCGAISLAAWPRTWRGDWRRLTRNSEAIAIVVMGTIASVLLVFALVFFDGYSWLRGIKVAPLLAFSAQTTSGFEAARVATLDHASKLILIFCMLVGGGVGSTAGGIKMARFMVLIRLIRYLMQRTRVPRHAVLDVESGGGAVDQREIYNVAGLAALFLIGILLSWLVFLSLGFDPMNSLFEIVSAVGTVGLSSGVTSSHLDLLPKALLCVDMLMGRLEFIAILLLFYPGTWSGKRAETT